MCYASFSLKSNKILNLLLNYTFAKHSTNLYTESMVAVHRALRSITQVYIKFSFMYWSSFSLILFHNIYTFTMYLLLTCCHMHIINTLLLKYYSKVFLPILFELLTTCFILCVGAMTRSWQFLTSPKGRTTG